MVKIAFPTLFCDRRCSLRPEDGAKVKKKGKETLPTLHNRTGADKVFFLFLTNSFIGLGFGLRK